MWKIILLSTRRKLILQNNELIIVNSILILTPLTKVCRCSLVDKVCRKIPKFNYRRVHFWVEIMSLNSNYAPTK